MWHYMHRPSCWCHLMALELGCSQDASWHGGAMSQLLENNGLSATHCPPTDSTGLAGAVLSRGCLYNEHRMECRPFV